MYDLTITGGTVVDGNHNVIYEMMSHPAAVSGLSDGGAHCGLICDASFGLSDRGVVAVGKKADLNVIDMDALTLHVPHMPYDLPAGGRRLIQGASGYDALLRGTC